MAGEYAVKVTVRNGLILRRMKELGIKSQAELARLAGLSVTALNALVALRRAPRNKVSGEWLDDAFTLSSALQVEPEELWSEAQQGMALKRNSYEVDMNEEEVKQLASGEKADKLALGSEQSRILRRALGSLTPREEQIVRRRFFEEETLGEIATDWNVTTSRALQVEAKALRKLKHPSRKLNKYFDEEVRAYPVRKHYYEEWNDD